MAGKVFVSVSTSLFEGVDAGRLAPARSARGRRSG